MFADVRKGGGNGEGGVKFARLMRTSFMDDPGHSRQSRLGRDELTVTASETLQRTASPFTVLDAVMTTTFLVLTVYTVDLCLSVIG